MYDIKQFLGHDATISQIYRYQNSVHELTYQNECPEEPTTQRNIYEVIE